MVFRNSVLLLLVHGALAGGDGAGDDHSACVYVRAHDHRDHHHHHHHHRRRRRRWTLITTPSTVQTRVYPWLKRARHDTTRPASRCNSAGYIVCENKGRIYSGQCEGDNREGYGVHQLADGARYEGEFSNGFIAGLGLNVLVDGSELRGMFSNGKLDGHGVYTWVNGTHGKRGSAGLGSRLPTGQHRPLDLTTATTIAAASASASTASTASHRGRSAGQLYEGEWSAGKRSGFGKLTYNAELSFEGKWEADEMAGMGVLDASGSTITGVFKGEWGTYT